MLEIFSYISAGGLLSILLIGGYFFINTKGSWLIQQILCPQKKTSDIYWIYKNSLLIWITDKQFIVSSILLGNYSKMVNTIVSSINSMPPKGKKILQVGCAFGNISRRIASECENSHLTIVDLIPNEIKNIRKKLKGNDPKNYTLSLEDATKLAQRDASFDCVVLFFLFHELPYQKKVEALKEASRVTKPGGKIIFGEFHKPEGKILRALGWLFFGVFEPYAEEMWGVFNVIEVLSKETPHKWRISKKTYCFGNYQVVEARKMH